MEEKKILSIEEIESQTVLELPDRQLMDADASAAAAQAINVALFLLSFLPF
jgi:hypothetical protein